MFKSPWYFDSKYRHVSFVEGTLEYNKLASVNPSIVPFSIKNTNLSIKSEENAIIKALIKKTI